VSANDRLELKRMAVENTLAYNDTATITTVKSLVQGPGVKVIKLFTAVIYEFL
jgi:hypothetical protein